MPRPAGAACCRTGERADPPYGGSLGVGTRREDLRRRIARGIRWRADTVTAPLVADEPVDVSDVAEIVGTRLEDGDWDIGVFLTDLPSRAERNPVSTEAAPEHRVALTSLPACRSRHLRRRRERQAVVGVVRQQTAQDEEPLASPVVGRPAPGEIPGAKPARCGAWAVTSASLWYPLLPFQRAVATRRSSVAATSAGRGNRER
ncbi:hypothetical protein RB199_11305 [Streptomyces libani]